MPIHYISLTHQYRDVALTDLEEAVVKIEEDLKSYRKEQINKISLDGLLG